MGWIDGRQIPSCNIYYALVYSYISYCCFLSASSPFTVYTIQETEDVLCVELETPEKNDDSNDIVKLGHSSASTSQDIQGVSKGSHSGKSKGKKRKKTNDDEDEDDEQPKLTSKQVGVIFKPYPSLGQFLT